MFKQLFVSSTSACFEFKNRAPYYSPKKYKVLLNGDVVGGEREENVFSLFNLQPMLPRKTVSIQTPFPQRPTSAA